MDFGGWTTPNNQVNYFKPKDRDGHLIGILSVDKVDEIFDEMRGENVKRAIVELIDFDGDNVIEKNVSIQHPAIVRRLSPDSSRILGRIGKVKTKSGFEAWCLLDPNEEDLKVAGQWSGSNNAAKNQDDVDAAADALRKLQG